MTKAAGATYARLNVDWRSVAPSTPPAGFVATDPTSPGYSWAGIDAIVEAAENAGLTPILDIVHSPDWAYQTQPKGVNAGSPKAADLGDFATALATHYDGLTSGAPDAHVFEVWNEPNLSLYLSPAKAGTYRAMVNAVADSVHAVDPSNLVVAGGLDPFGHPHNKNKQGGIRFGHWPSCARCSACRRDPIRTRRAAPRSTSMSGRTIRTRTAARSGARRFPMTSSSATSPQCERS